jgi:hypothetical protein
MPPADTTSLPPFTTVRLARPPDDTVKVPPLDTSLLLARPPDNTSSLPPLEMAAPLVTPPVETVSVPPFDTRLLRVMPPDDTTSLPPLFGTRQLVVMGVLAAVAVTAVGGASAQSVSALTQPEPQTQAPAKPVKPMTPERTAWLKKRCAQLVALFDYYNVSRGENSDGPRNHRRIGAVIECERSNYRYGIDTMATLLLNKAEEIPRPDVPAFEPEDAEAPDITNPTKAWWYLR